MARVGGGTPVSVSVSGRPLSAPAPVTGVSHNIVRATVNTVNTVLIACVYLLRAKTQSLVSYQSSRQEHASPSVVIEKIFLKI